MLLILKSPFSAIFHTKGHSGFLPETAVSVMPVDLACADQLTVSMNPYDGNMVKKD
jgi:hypothetical protein